MCAPGATDVDDNRGLLSPLTDVEKAIAHAAKHLPDTERDALLKALHLGCVFAPKTVADTRLKVKQKRKKKKNCTLQVPCSGWGSGGEMVGWSGLPQ